MRHLHVALLFRGLNKT